MGRDHLQPAVHRSLRINSSSAGLGGQPSQVDPVAADLYIAQPPVEPPRTGVVAQHHKARRRQAGVSGHVLGQPEQRPPQAAPACGGAHGHRDDKSSPRDALSKALGDVQRSWQIAGQGSHMQGQGVADHPGQRRARIV